MIKRLLGSAENLLSAISYAILMTACGVVLFLFCQMLSKWMIAFEQPNDFYLSTQTLRMGFKMPPADPFFKDAPAGWYQVNWAIWGQLLLFLNVGVAITFFFIDKSKRFELFWKYALIAFTTTMVMASFWAFYYRNAICWYIDTYNTSVQSYQKITGKDRW